MNTFEEILLTNITPVVAMACIAMFIIGLIKIFTKMLIDEQHEKVKKVFSGLYIIMSLILSFGLVLVYFKIFSMEFNWVSIIKISSEVYACTQALYPIYRDYGGRFLLKKFLTLFKHKNKDLDAIIDTIEKVLVLTENQKKQLKEELSE